MPPAPNQVLTISELTRRIKGLLEGQFPALWVEGEISNFAAAPSGHCYFTLKDANAQLAAVMFRAAAGKLNFRVADGQQVLAFGNLSVYDRRGQYQLVVTQLLPKGLGALQLAFEQLKQKLAAEGLFAPERKKPLPVLPARIGVVTSPTGAAIRDFLKILGRRYPNRHVIIYPVRVQGDGAAAEIAAAIDHFNELGWTGVPPLRPVARPTATGETPVQHVPLVDVIVVTRGGGSLEDLWAFNEEIVARAIARSRLPIISAVGHEIDFTIADFVADLRAPTPSAAAELVVRAKDELLAELRQYQHRLDKDLRYRLSEARRRLASCALRQPDELVRQYQQRVDDLAHRLDHATGNTLETQRHRLTRAREKLQLLTPQAFVRQLRHRLATADQRLTGECARHRQAFRHRFATLAGKLELLSPKSTLARGYSITRTPSGRVVRTVGDVQPGQSVRTLVTDGEFESVVAGS